MFVSVCVLVVCVSVRVSVCIGVSVCACERDCVLVCIGVSVCARVLALVRVRCVSECWCLVYVLATCMCSCL